VGGVLRTQVWGTISEGGVLQMRGNGAGGGGLMHLGEGWGWSGMMHWGWEMCAVWGVSTQDVWILGLLGKVWAVGDPTWLSIASCGGVGLVDYLWGGGAVGGLPVGREAVLARQLHGSHVAREGCAEWAG
jgi:hypothetical protein